MVWMWIAVAGAGGALARHAVNLAVGARPFPVATLAINMAGSFLLGLLLHVAGAGRISPQVATALAVGLLGGFTTYSTFSVEAFTLGRTDRLGLAALYVAVSVVGGLLAAGLGYRLGLRLTR